MVGFRRDGRLYCTLKEMQIFAREKCASNGGEFITIVYFTLGRSTRKFTTRSQTYSFDLGFGNALSEKSLKKFLKSLLQNSYRSNFLIRSRTVLFFGHPLTGAIAVFYIFKCLNFAACNGIRFKRFLFFSRQSVVDRLTIKRSLAIPSRTLYL